MTSANPIRARLALRGWPVAAAPTRLLVYLAVGELGTLAWISIALARFAPSAHAMGLTGLLAVIAIVFEEGVNRATRLEIRLSAGLRRTMTSVWTVAGAIALPPGGAVLLVGTVLVYSWFRVTRRTGRPLYREIFNGCAAMLACLSASLVVHHALGVSSGSAWALTAAITVLVAIAVHAVVNRALISIALVCVGAKLKDLRATPGDNLIEFATLCLGGLVAIAALHEPWLSILVLAPMVTLQRGALVRELETAATVDSKTGLLNAVAWEHVLSRELARAAREDKPLAVLIIDIDRFKLVNDRFGHLAGDAVLREVGRCLQSGLREFDTIGRFGGEEFVAVLPSAGDSEGLVVAERLRSRVAALPLASIVDSADDADELHLSVSVGVSTSPTDGAELQELLVAADAALYKAKAAGRNRVVLAERGTGPAFEPVAHS
jgi:diguanylate cyclase (GGDEF) domain